MPKKENNAEEKKLEELVEDIKLSDESNKKDDEESKEEKDEEQNEEKENENENENESESENETSKDDNNNENGDDGEGWINPGNLEKIKKESKVDAEQENLGSTKIKVACMTSDFAMQVLNIKINISKKLFFHVFRCKKRELKCFYTLLLSYLIGT